MSGHEMPVVVADPWHVLRQFTAARIALGRAGVSLPKQAHLAFQLAHAQARDAVHHAFDVERMRAELSALSHDVLVLRSAAGDRTTYLQRPDLGRRLDAACRQALEHRDADDADQADGQCDLVVVVADGLSARAVGQHAVPILERILQWTQAAAWSVGPLVLVEQGRVAIGDEVGELLGARMVVVLIGERPGLSSPDSMGAYLTWMPAVGLTDASRNCISNIRPAGLAYDEAARRLQYLMGEARARALSGVALKDESGSSSRVASSAASSSFLLTEQVRRHDPGTAD